jgi:D-alanyl-D-alanine carboxypeptidase
MIMNKNYLIITFILFSAQLLAQTKNQYSKLDSFLNAIERNNKLMGVVSYAKNDSILYLRPIGNAVVTQDKAAIKNTRSTLFKIGSVSKMFTAVMILQLAEEEKINLGDPVSKFFSGIKSGKDITLEMLLHHRSGLVNLKTGISKKDLEINLKNKGELVSVLGGKEPEFEPGTKSSYNDFNYVLLGYIIEKVTKDSYQNALNQRISQKIGLKYTHVDTATTNAAGQARAYEFVDAERHLYKGQQG